MSHKMLGKQRHVMKSSACMKPWGGWSSSAERMLQKVGGQRGQREETRAGPFMGQSKQLASGTEKVASEKVLI